MTKAQFEEAIAPVNKTVKNGVDTSVSNSQNNSSFSYNAKYAAYSLHGVAGIFGIIKKESK